MVPLIIHNWTYACVYHPLWPNSSNTAHVGCATRLLVRHNLSHTTNVGLQSISFPYTPFNTTCLPTTHSPTVTVHYLRFLHQCINCPYTSTTSQNPMLLRLQVNPAKTEFIWFGSHVNLTRIPQRCRSIQVCGSVMECEVVVRDLGVYLDSELSMKHHVNKIASALLLPGPETALDSPLCQQRNPETAGDITRPIPLGLLQRTPGVDTIVTSTCTECRRPSRARC